MNDQIGIFHGVSFEEYAAIDALNGSSLVNMRRSPMYYRWCLDNPQPPTPAMILGTATHRLILEPERVGDFAVWGGIPEHFTEKGNLRPRNGKDWDAFRTMHADKMIVTQAERDDMIGITVAARRNAPMTKYISAKGNCEVVMVWRDKESGRLFKGRADKIIDARAIIFDLKTARSCQHYKFAKQAYALGYHIKMAIYWSGYTALTKRVPHMKIGAIESKAPYESAVYSLNTDIILQGLDDLVAILKKLPECEESGSWPAAEPEELELTLPSYAFPEAQDDLSDLELVEG